jgi:hypothetical protein
MRCNALYRYIMSQLSPTVNTPFGSMFEHAQKDGERERERERDRETERQRETKRASDRS